MREKTREKWKNKVAINWNEENGGWVRFGGEVGYGDQKSTLGQVKFKVKKALSILDSSLAERSKLGL